MAGVVAAKLKLKKQQQEEEEAKVMVDFNETKQYNDTHNNDHGHDDNDQVLTHHQQKQDTVFKIHSFFKKRSFLRTSLTQTGQKRRSKLIIKGSRGQLLR